VCDGALPALFATALVVVLAAAIRQSEEATYLTKFASAVNMVVRRDELRASKIMQDRAFIESKDQT